MATLSREDIHNLIRILKDSFKSSEKQREEHILAKHIQLPKVPPVLSEGIVANLLLNKKILAEQNIIELSSNHGLADIVARTADGIIKIEVKSTGESAFQQLGKKDIAADFLIWLHFDRFFKDEKIPTFEVYVIRNPSHYFSEPCKITLSKLKLIIPELEPEIFSVSEI